MKLEPDRAQIEAVVEALFKHAAPGSYVSLRSFYDDGRNESFKIKAVLIDDRKAVIDVACGMARQAANAKAKIVFCPPTTTFSNAKHAGKIDVADGLTLSAECDKNPQAARDTLEKLLGPATLIVSSGGEWVNPETGEIEDKLHIHYRLKQPACGDDRDVLEQARKLMIELVGSDPSHGPISHPIRWPGSWHRKGTPKLCRIVHQRDCEIDLRTALAALKAARPAETSSHAGDSTAEGEQDETKKPNWGELIKDVLTSEKYHEPLTRMALKLLVAGMQPGAAVNFLRGLMEAATPPDHRRADWQARYDHDIPHAVSTAEEKHKAPPAPEIILTPHDFPNGASIERWDFLYSRHLLRKTVSGTAAAGATGKTTLSLAEALAIASGKPLLGEEVPIPLRVMLVALEDNRNSMDKRIAAAMKHFKLTPKDIGGRLFVRAKGEIKFKLATQVKGSIRINTELIEQTVTLLRKHRIDVLSLDPFIRLHSIPENDNSLVADLVEAFDDIAERADCAISLWHHTRKGGGGPVTVESARGAGAFIDACRSIRICETMTESEADKQQIIEDRRKYFRVFSGKLNFAPPPEKSTWFHLVSVSLENGGVLNLGDDVGVVDRFVIDESADGIELNADEIAAIRAAVKAGECARTSARTCGPGRPSRPFSTSTRSITRTGSRKSSPSWSARVI